MGITKLKYWNHFLFIGLSTLFSLGNSSAMADGWLFPPLTISSVVGTNISDVQIGTASNGTSVAIWQENGQIQTSSASFGGSWSSPTTLSVTTGSSPCIYVDPNENATALWIENEILYSSSMPAGGNWSAPLAISSSGVSQPLIQGDLSGNAVALWERGNAIESSTLPFGGSWPVSPDVLSNANSSSPALWVSDNGYVAVAWTQVVNTINAIYALQKKIGSSWSTAVPISTPTQNSVYPAISIGAQNQAVAVWFIYDLIGTIYSNVYVQAATQDASQNWSTPVNLSDPDSPGLIDPSQLVTQIAIDDLGNAIAVWTMSTDGSTFSVQSKLKSTSSIWDAQATLISVPNPFTYSLDISSESAGKVLITWMYLNQALNQLTVQSVLCSYGAGDFFRSNLPLSVLNDNYYPDGAVATGMSAFYATAAWINNDGTNTSVEAIQGSKNFPLPPMNLNIQETQTTHAIFTDTAYILTWNASPSANVIAYYLYRDGELIFQDFNQTLMFTDHNRTPGATGTYEITAFTFGGLESSPATISYP